MICTNILPDGTRVWKQLVPPTINQVWELVSWDDVKGEYIKDGGPAGKLQLMKYSTGLPSSSVNRYAGIFPSKQACDFINSRKEKMKYFDDGERLVYGKQEPRIVDVDRPEVKHPIPNPPAGFVVEDNTWVFRKSVSKYL